MAIPSKRLDVPDLVAIRRALISVSDKSGIVDFARELVARNIEILSTGGTARVLVDAGLPVIDISSLTGFPEIMDGRVKTLHPAIHGGLLAVRADPAHQQALDDHAIRPIDLLVIDLYPFETVRASQSDPQTIVENIDIGGPAMIRAGAKNHAYVTVLTDPADYASLLAELDKQNMQISLVTRQNMAAKAYRRTAAYDAAIAAWFADEMEMTGKKGEQDAPCDLPRHLTLGGTRASVMRYGENPHQAAALYLTGSKRKGAANARLVQGKPLSYNNLNDADAAFELASEFDPKNGPVCAIIKHANPCGVAGGATLEEAYRKALACDPVSAYGGIIAMNTQLDGEAARAMKEVFTEVIIAPCLSEDAMALIGSKKNLRLLVTDGMPDPGTPGLAIRTIAGGFLAQSRDNGRLSDRDVTTVTRRAPTDKELMDLLFAFRVAKHVKSNAIVYVRGGATVGIGAGQMSRVDASRIAAQKALDVARAAGHDKPATIGSVVASDAFFPFADGLLAAIAAGATAVIQPGGSMRDEEVIAAADEAGIAMVFTGMRHFRH